MSAVLRVLLFHDIVPASECTRSNYSDKLFRYCMHFLHRRGHSTVDLCSAIETLRAGGRLPKKSFAIAFDDGYASTHATAFPVMAPLGFTATLFVTPGEQDAPTVGCIGGGRMLAWSQVRALVDAGWHVGSHGLNHRDLSRLDVDALTYELVESKRLIESRSGAQVVSLAYPFGRHNKTVREVARDHYRCGFATQPGLTDTADPFALARIDMAYFRRKLLVPLLTTPMLGNYLRLPRPWAGRSTPGEAT